MSDEESSPLLSQVQPVSIEDDPAENTPLLSSNSDTPRYDGENDQADGSRSVRSSRRNSDTPSQRSTKRGARRWASITAMVVLATLIAVIIVLAFIVPNAVQEYAKQAVVVEPTNLSLESITTDGVQARIQANFWMDSSKVTNNHFRRLGRASTWVAHKLGIKESTVGVYLPDYHDILLGSAVIPPMVVNLRDGAVTNLDFVADISPGDVEGIRMIANDWMDGRLDTLRLNGKADLALKSGLIPLGTHTVSETLIFQAGNIPAIPKYNISRLVVDDGPIKGSMVASMSLSTYNHWPVQLDIPELAFDILVPGCKIGHPIMVANAVTSEIHVRPEADVKVDATGVIRGLSEDLTRACPHSDSSPLDILFWSFMHGQPATMLVRGSHQPDGSTPKWIADILSSVTVPVPFPGRSLDGLIRNFSLTDTHFSLPSPIDPDSDPTVSGNILVTAAVPSDMNFSVNVTNVRATSDVLYNNKKMGELNVKEWQPSNSTRVWDEESDEALLQIQSRIDEAPLTVTDSDVFTEVLQQLVFGKDVVKLDVDATVDVKVITTLGDLVIKGVPAEGKIPVKPLLKGSLDSFIPQLGSVKVLDSTADSITLEALVNATNPSPYTAHLPYANVHLLGNDSVLGDVTVRDLDIVKGNNTNMRIVAKWNPSADGERGRQVARTLLSQYLSGMNTTLTVKAHHNTIPGQPLISDGFSKLNITLPAPKMDLPGDKGEDGKSHFIQDAIFHFFSSTATFTLASPLDTNTVYLEYINATALYNHTEPIGQILYDRPFSAPPGLSETPKLPVSWSVGSVGYDAIKNAIGGELKLDTYADVDIRLGNWRESLWYKGEGIGAKIRL